MLFRSLSTKLAAIVALSGLFVPGAALAKGHAAPTPAPTVAPSPPPEDPEITRVARREFVSWQAGNVDLNRYSADAKVQLTPDKITKTSKQLGLLGALVRTEFLTPVVFEDAPAGVKGYLYHMVCTQGAVYEQLVIDAQGKVTGILFRDKLEQQ